VRFLIFDACEDDLLASSFGNEVFLIETLTPRPDSEPQMSTRILNLSVITHHQSSSTSSSSSPSSNSREIPREQPRVTTVEIDRH
jgi:hypothetical protein